MADKKTWFKFYRELINHPLVGFQKPFSRAEAWIWLLSEAKFDDSRDLRDFGGKQRYIITPRGSITHSIRFLARTWGWSPIKTTTFIKQLKNEYSITLKTIQQITQITICNYDKYQSIPAQQQEQQAPKIDTATNQAIGTNNKNYRTKELKELKKKETSEIVFNKINGEPNPEVTIKGLKKLYENIEAGKCTDENI